MPFGNVCAAAGDGAGEGEEMVVEVVGGDGAFGFEDEAGGFGGGEGFEEVTNGFVVVYLFESGKRV